ncbi:MAG: amidohydrolase [Oscillospiraceae bacterium]|nr:amidohydrolase [Oscillospiraceae bacterium]
MKHIVDAHCHIYPDAIASRAVSGIDTFYDGLPGEHYDGTMSTLLHSGGRAGIDHFIIFSVATKPTQVKSINEYLADCAARSSGRFTPLGAMHLDSEDMEADLAHLMELGLRGVKMHPDVQDFVIDEPRAMKLYEMCEDKGLPIYVHTGDYRYDRSNPNRTVNVLKAFPKLKFIGPHFGGWSVWEDALRLLPDFPNIMVDTSSSFYLMKKDFAREIIRAYGSERVMYGTDYPMWPQRDELDFLASLDLTEKEYEDIGWRTCAKLFDISL